MKTLLSLILAGGLVAFTGSCLITEQTIHLVRRLGMVDLPGHRRSHIIPTPRGGGLAIAAVTLASVPVVGALQLLPWRVVAGVLLGGAIVAVTGWLDDGHQLPVLPRAGAHLAAALVLVWSVGGLPHLQVGIASVNLGRFGTLIAIVGVVWAINLFNFMDGADGLAASEAAVVGLAVFFLMAFYNSLGLAFLAMVVAAASAGFLVWNWHPAKVFMGDVSSGLLGFEFAALALMGERSGHATVLPLITALGVFLVDATGTLLRRVAKGEKWYEPHREHAYQLAIQHGYSHRQVTATVVVIDCMLGFLALAMMFWPSTSGWIALTSVTALTLGWAEVVRRISSPPEWSRARVRSLSSERDLRS